MHRRTLVAGLAATTALAACGTSLPAGAGSGTLIVVRHGERTGEDLNAEGLARAAALPGALASLAVDGIYAPDTRRNIDTATPLAQAKGLTVQVIPAVDVARAMFRRQPGGTLVWVGNKDNIVALWDEIGATGEPPLLYGDLVVVAMNGLRAGRIQRLHFGA